MTPKARAAIRDAMLHEAQKRPLIMGILNLTPDSFSDGGLYNTDAGALRQANTLIAEGADILDIGGESTRPGASIVSAKQELQRTIGAVTRLAASQPAPVSIDTYKAIVAREAAKAGAVLINDISGMLRDPDMADAVSSTESAVVITYNRGETSEALNIVDDARAFFDKAFSMAERAGIPKDHIWLDPGVGFSKTQEQNIEILKRLDVVCAYNRPVLVGLSRKSFIGHLLDQPLERRLPGTLAANLTALHKGARIFRVHDVGEHKDAISLQQTLMTG